MKQFQKAPIKFIPKEHRKKFETDYGCIPVISATGDWKKVKGLKYAINRLITLMSIIEGSYPYDPEFGVKFPLYIFQKDDIYNEIKSELEYKITKYEKDFLLNDINMKIDETRKMVELECFLTYMPTGEEIQQNIKIDAQGNVTT